MSDTREPVLTPAWSALFSLLHPAQIAVVEAFEWIGEPMSTDILEEVLDRSFPIGTVGYYLPRLAAAGVLVEQPRVGGRRAERFYLLAT
jgi:hypothetical protein